MVSTSLKFAQEMAILDHLTHYFNCYKIVVTLNLPCCKNKSDHLVPAESVWHTLVTFRCTWLKLGSPTRWHSKKHQSALIMHIVPVLLWWLLFATLDKMDDENNNPPVWNWGTTLMPVGLRLLFRWLILYCFLQLHLQHPNWLFNNIKCR